jgi:hypothetical protein
MTERVNDLPRDQFVALWNLSATLDEALARVRAAVGSPCPRWAVMARAAACRADGVALKRFPAPGKCGDV